jgi:hypothetical protein
MAVASSLLIFFTPSVPFLFTLLRSFLSALVLLLPAFKSYRALHSRNVSQCQAMLVYWCVATFLIALREMFEDFIPDHSTLSFRFLLTFLRLFPLALGEGRIFQWIIEPLFECKGLAKKIIKLEEKTKETMINLVKENEQQIEYTENHEVQAETNNRENSFKEAESVRQRKLTSEEQEKSS